MTFYVLFKYISQGKYKKTLHFSQIVEKFSGMQRLILKLTLRDIVSDYVFAGKVKVLYISSLVLTKSVKKVHA